VAAHLHKPSALWSDCWRNIPISLIDLSPAHENLGGQVNPGTFSVLYYTKEDESGIWRMPAGGGDEIEVVPQLSPEYWGDWALSNRGIYYIRGVSKHPVVEFFDISSHKVSKIAALNSPPPMYDPGFAVSPDGKRILFSQVDNSGVDIMLVENFH
jgi:hypothetical protein